MQYTVRLGDHETVLEAGSMDEDGVCLMVAEGDRREVTIKPVAPHQVHVTACPAEAAGEDEPRQPAPEHSRNLFIARAADGVWVWAAGRARLVSPATEQRTARRGRAGGSRGPVTPPMPAVVTELRVEVGQAVAEGQALVVVSAMKMEISLSAPHAGTVSAVHTQVGAKVNPGDILVELTPLGTDGDEAPESHS